MICDDLRIRARIPSNLCVETDDGARVTTHCLYPSFEPVDGVHCALWERCIASTMAEAPNGRPGQHGRHEQLIGRIPARHAARYQLKVVVDGVLLADAQSL